MQYNKENTLAAYMNVSILKFIVLSIVTLGFYGFFWQHKFNKALDYLKLEPFAGKARSRFLAMLVFWVVGILAQISGSVSENPTLEMIGLVSSLISSILNIIWAYDIRAGIRLYCAEEFKLNYTANAILVFFFPGLTLTYAVNNIDHEVRFNKTLNQTSTSL